MVTPLPASSATHSPAVSPSPQAAELPRRPSAQSTAHSLDSLEAQEGSPSETTIHAERLVRRASDRSTWSPRPRQPRATTSREGALLQAFCNGSDAATYLGLNALTSCSAASFLTDGVLARDGSEIGLGVGLMAVAALDALLAEHKTRALTRQLGSFAPRGLSGPHTLTQAGFVAGGALYTFGVDQDRAELYWGGLAVLSVAWLSTSIQLSRLIDAIGMSPVALGDDDARAPAAYESHIESTSEATGNPWAVMLMLLGSHGAGQAIAAGNDVAAVVGGVAALCGAELAHQSRQGDTLFWLALSGVGAGVLGYTTQYELPWLRFGAGLVVGLGAIHNLYYTTTQPVVRAQARRRHCPTLIPAMD